MVCVLPDRVKRGWRAVLGICMGMAAVEEVQEERTFLKVKSSIVVCMASSLAFRRPHPVGEAKVQHLEPGAMVHLDHWHFPDCCFDFYLLQTLFDVSFST